MLRSSTIASTFRSDDEIGWGGGFHGRRVYAVDKLNERFIPLLRGACQPGAASFL